MNKELSVLGITISILLFGITTSSVTAQNATTNASNAVGNVSAPQPANQTAERGENVSLALNETANQTSEVGQNMSNAVGNASQSANQTVSELGTNASTALNKTAEVAKGIGSGAADVLGNISGEIQQGISGNK